jgi:transcriptional regulator with XRE-family HTH domain
MTNKHSKPDMRSNGAQDARQLFAAQIRAARAVLGWSQTDLGERTGVTQRAIYRVENGATEPRQLTRLRIEKAFDDAGVAFESLQTGGFTMSVRPVNGVRASGRPKLSRRQPEAR